MNSAHNLTNGEICAAWRYYQDRILEMIAEMSVSYDEARWQCSFYERASKILKQEAEKRGFVLMTYDEAQCYRTKLEVCREP
jgi:hypothetical protein